MEHDSQVDAMHNSKKQLTQMASERIEPKRIAGCWGGSNNLCCHACGDEDHPPCTYPTEVTVYAAWKEKPAAVNRGTEKKEKHREERHRGFCGGRKKGSYGGRGGGNQQSLHLAQTSEGDNDNAKVTEVKEVSDSTSDDGNSDGSGLRNHKPSD